MNPIQIFIIALGLATDAFAASVCIGLNSYGDNTKKALTAGLYFGGFQGGMPIIGFFAASILGEGFHQAGHWIAFALFLLIGGKMIWESRKKEDAQTADVGIAIARMLPLAIATSIDALAVGVSFALLEVNIFFAAGIIGLTTFITSAIGVKLGTKIGAQHRRIAVLVGGIVLIVMGVLMVV
ncbi:MAG: manganese efflux pump MntP family protein [Oscillospiraceae bacterium]|nr:manganese efflux pump MntP family protein [Oscillospiraceae bacterium]